MEINTDGQGRFRVTFNGTLYANCSTDFDCPGELICVRNRAWLQDAEQCLCPLSLGRTGLFCHDQNSSSWVLVAISAVAVAISFLCFLVNLLSLYYASRDESMKVKVLRRSALFTTLVLTTVACLMICLQTIYQIISHFTPRLTPIQVNGSLTKQSSLIYFNLATTTTSFFFGVCAALNVSLVLIEIADRVSKGNSKIHVNVFIYRNFLIGYATIFGVLIVAFSASGRAEWTFALAAPAALFIAITFFVAWLRMSRLFTANEVKQANKAAGEKVSSALANIRFTTLFVSLCAFGLVTCGILQILLEPLNRPNQSYGAIPGRLFWVFASLFMLAITRYARVHIVGKMGGSRKPSSQPAGQEQKQDRLVLDKVNTLDITTPASPGLNLIDENQVASSSSS